MLDSYYACKGRLKGADHNGLDVGGGRLLSRYVSKRLKQRQLDMHFSMAFELLRKKESRQGR